LYVVATATSLTLLSLFVAGASPGPNALLLAVVTLVPPMFLPLWAAASFSPTAATPRP
jgi:hypothetical protein